MSGLGFCCPVCGGELELKQNSAVCTAGHNFDRARQGYLHLLMSNKMHSKLPGDTAEMVNSRRRFLDGGYYGIFRDELCRLVCKYAPDEAPTVLDAGCGEGYYTAGVSAALPKARIFGFDISKSAVKAAAGKYKNILFAVASSFAIPVVEGFCDVLIDMFSPLAEVEFARAVKPGGYFIYAVPGERHLLGLKNILYENPYENERKDTEYAGFEFVERVNVKGSIELPDSETAMDLFSMTPYYWKTGVDGGRRLAESGGFSTEIEFDFLVYRRKCE